MLILRSLLFSFFFFMPFLFAGQNSMQNQRIDEKKLEALETQVQTDLLKLKIPLFHG
jgi:hypothetical protein